MNDKTLHKPYIMYHTTNDAIQCYMYVYGTMELQWNNTYMCWWCKWCNDAMMQ